MAIDRKGERGAALEEGVGNEASRIACPGAAIAQVPEALADATNGVPQLGVVLPADAPTGTAADQEVHAGRVAGVAPYQAIEHTQGTIGIGRHSERDVVKTSFGVGARSEVSEDDVACCVQERKLTHDFRSTFHSADHLVGLGQFVKFVRSR